MKNLLVVACLLTVAAFADVAKVTSENGDTVEILRVPLEKGNTYYAETKCVAKGRLTGSAKIGRGLTLVYEAFGAPIPIQVETIGKDYNPPKYSLEHNLDAGNLVAYVSGIKGQTVDFSCETKVLK